MPETELRRAEVDLTGLLEVLGRNLYSTPVVALRELIQNAHDSCVRRRLEGGDDAPTQKPEIRVRVEPAQGRLEIEDTGAGLTRDEIVNYLARLGSGYTRVLREASGPDAEPSLIGRFGLGFLTAYFVSDRVEVWTCSYTEPERAWRFSSQNGERYSVGEAPSRPVGTRVSLHIQPSAAELLDPEVVRSVLAHYCELLPLPIYFGNEETAVNAEPPPWREEAASPLRRKKLELAFAARHESVFEPLCALPVLSDGPARGLLWIQDGASYATSDHRHVSVYVRGMLVSDDERELLPAWAGFVGGAVECDELEPTASREALQRDTRYAEVADQLRRSLVQGLLELAEAEPEIWRSVLSRHNEPLLGAALSDPALFERVRDFLTLPTSEGDLRIPELLERAGNRIPVALGEGGSAEEILFGALGVPVVSGWRYAAHGFCTRYGDEAGVPVLRVGTEAGNEALFPHAQIEPGELHELANLLGSEQAEVVPTRFEPAFLPCVWIANRDAELKARLESDEADRRIGSAILGLARQHTATIVGGPLARLYVNLDSPIVERLLAASDVRQKQLGDLLRGLSQLLANRPGRGGGDLSQSLQHMLAAAESLVEESDSGHTTTQARTSS